MSHPLEQLRDAALREIAAAARRANARSRARPLSRPQRQHLRLGRADEDAQQRRAPGRRQTAERSAHSPSPRRSSKRQSAFAQRKKRATLRQHRHLASGHARRTRRAPSAHPNARPRDRNFSPHGIRARGRTGCRDGMALLRRAQHARPIIRRETNRTRFICPTVGCSARTLRPCRSARWKPRRRRSASSRRARLIGATKSTPLTARSSTRSKGFMSMKTSASRI